MSLQILSRNTIFIGCIAVFVIAFIAGCSLPHQELSEHNHSHGEEADSHDDADAHEHEETAEPISLWTDTLELFGEVPLFETGESQRLLLHLTFVQTGLPVQGVPVTFSAIRHESGATFTGQGSEVQPGIYAVETTFPEGGEWSFTVDVLMEEGLASVTMADLDVHGEDEHHDHEHEHQKEETHSNLIAFTKEQQWLVPVVTVPVSRGTVTERHRVPASVLATPDVRNVAAAIVSGIAATCTDAAFPKVGDKVEAGQVLAVLSTESMTAESLARDANVQGVQSLRVELDVRAIAAAGEATRARALVARHTSALQRAEALLEAGANSQREVEMLRSDLAEAQAALAAAERIAQRAQQALTKTDAVDPSVVRVVAPIQGQITHVFAGPGTLVSGGEPLFEIVNTAQVIIEARVPESLATRVETSPSGMFEVPGRPGELYEIVLPEGAPEPWLLPDADETTRTVPALFHAANPDGLLRAGMSLAVWMDVRHVEDAVRVPASAVVDENGMPTVYVMVGGEQFQKRNVRLGISDGAYMEVLDGVQPEERVVSQGAYAIRLAGLGGAGLGSAHVH